jgi:hypothetical protein
MVKKILISCMLLIGAAAAHAQQHTFSCNMLEVITRHPDAFPHIDKKTKIILIDTFKIFTPDCNGTYGGREIEVLNTIPAKIEPEMFSISNIMTSKSEGFIISILQILTRHGVGYSISVSRQNIAVTKTTIGDF